LVDFWGDRRGDVPTLCDGGVINNLHANSPRICACVALL